MIANTSSMTLKRVKTKPGTSFDGNDKQEDEVVSYNGPCSCGATAGGYHCHLLFVEETNGS